MSDPQPIQLNNSNLSESPLPPKTGSSTGYMITAIIFFLLGFMAAGLIGFSVFGAEPYADPTMVEAAVVETFIALTPTATATATPAPIQLTFSDRDYLLAGSWDAPVYFVEFSDYRCPWCGRFAIETLPQLMEKYEGQVAFIYRDYPIFGEESVRAAHAAACAAEQETFTDYHFQLFASQQQDVPMAMEDNNLLAIARSLNLDESNFGECLARESISQGILQNYIDGHDLLIEAGTPAFLINGRRFSGAGSLQFFSRIIDEELEKQGIEPPL